MNTTREELESERAFLLRSLDDLDDERANGNIDDETYRVLHEDYTARASAVIRSLEGDLDPDVALATAETEAPPAPARLKWITIGGVVLFCVVAAVLLATQVGQRRPGQTITGNAQVTKPQSNAIPDTYGAHVAAARQALQNQDFQGAVEQYTAAIRNDPKQAEPYAYRGWVSVLVARAVQDAGSRDLLLQKATKDFDKALAVDPNFFDTYFFKGYTLFQVENKPGDAVPLFQQFLAKAPTDHPMHDQVAQVLAQAVTAAKNQPKP